MEYHTSLTGAFSKKLVILHHPSHKPNSNKAWKPLKPLKKVPCLVANNF